MTNITTLADFELLYDNFYDVNYCKIMHEHMRRIYQWGHDIQFEGDALGFDEIFGDIDLHRLDSQIIASIFRATYHLRPYLTNWPDKYDEACDLLLYRGEVRLATELLKFNTYTG